MQLVELLKSLAEWDDEQTIYVAQPWSCKASAMLLIPSNDTTEPVVAGPITYEYFLELFIAKQVLEDFTACSEGASATEWQRCERLIRYARDDA